VIYAIVLAGGSGKRFGGNTPKQYRDLFGRPVLAWSLQAFEKSRVDAVILVCAEKDISYCYDEIIKRYGITKCVSIASGGENRYDSVLHGLEAASHHLEETGKGESFCLIHDGARPCIDVETIDRAIEHVTSKGSCVVGVKVTDTIQIVNGEGNISMTPDRTHTWAAQTPQCFELYNALNSYKKAVENGDDTITDDASAVRKYGEGSIYMLKGKKENIKITTEDDLKTAEEILRKRNK
jgi:2-C-methyl-D-erythritol 4-phosphate cytidylyltransferase